MKKIVLPIIIVLAVAAGIYFILKRNKAKNAAETAVVAQKSGAVSVGTTSAQRRVLDMDFKVNGTFAPVQQLNFTAETPGRVTALYVQEGQRVTRGQLIAKVDNSIATDDRAAAEAAYQNSVRDLSRYENSLATGGVTQQQVDQQRLAVRTNKLRVDQARKNASNANVVSSITGYVNKRMVEVGSYVSPGTPMFELVDVSKLKLQVNVNEAQVANLGVGNTVGVTTTVYPDERFTGKVTFIAAKADGSLNFPVEITVANNGSKQLRAGMYGTANFKFTQKRPVIVVPRTAFVGSVSSNMVYVVENGHAKSRSVTAGQIIGDEVEVLNGISEGEQVIISGQINLVDGTAVSVIK